ncbi:hypothetical protein WJR50_21565 [Catalinimonas sp. 4WD22]|uniref:hypothetical protein n=1 Tax=Catalinimonas locisalis TaxID=3133978 RepID=UPI003100D6FE
MGKEQFVEWYSKLTAEDCIEKLTLIQNKLKEIQFHLPVSLEAKTIYLRYLKELFKHENEKISTPKKKGFRELMLEKIKESNKSEEEKNELLKFHAPEETNINDLQDIFFKMLSEEANGMSDEEKNTTHQLTFDIIILLKSYDFYLEAWIKKGGIRLNNRARSKLINDLAHSIDASKTWSRLTGDKNDYRDLDDILSHLTTAKPKEKYEDNRSIVEKYTDLWKPGAMIKIHNILGKKLNVDDKPLSEPSRRSFHGFTGSRSELVTAYLIIKEKGYFLENNNTIIGECFFEYYGKKKFNQTSEYSKKASFKLVDEYERLIPPYQSSIDL